MSSIAPLPHESSSTPSEARPSGRAKHLALPSSHVQPRRRLSDPVVAAAAREASLMLRQAIELAPSSFAAVAAALHVSESQVGRWCDPDEDDAFTERDRLLLPPKVRAALRQLEEERDTVAALEDRRSVHEAALSVCGRSSTVALEVTKAVADLTVTREERRSILAALGKLVSSVLRFLRLALTHER